AVAVPDVGDAGLRGALRRRHARAARWRARRRAMVHPRRGRRRPRRPERGPGTAAGDLDLALPGRALVSPGPMSVVLRPSIRADLGVLSVWLAAPHVARWWRDPNDESSIHAAYGPAIDGDDPTEVLIAEVNGRPIGMVQRYLLSDNPVYQRALAPAGATAA